MMSIKYVTLICILLGQFVWSDIPTVQVLTGAVLIDTGGLYISYRETIRRRHD
jgi:hypothetical protein